MQGDLECPRCGQQHLRIHTCFGGDESKELGYELECMYCHYQYGYFKSPAEAMQTYLVIIKKENNNE